MATGLGDRRTKEGKDEEFQSWVDWFSYYTSTFAIDPDDLIFEIQEIRDNDSRRYDAIYKEWSALHKAAKRLAGLTD